MQSKKILTNVYLHDIVNNVVKHGGVSEWFKELVLKTSDLARDQEFESLLLRHFVYYIMICFNKFHCFGEILKWWRGSPAKGVGRVTGARVQIPLSPPKVANLLGLAAFLFLLLNCKNGGKLLKILRYSFRYSFSISTLILLTASILSSIGIRT